MKRKEFFEVPKHTMHPPSPTESARDFLFPSPGDTLFPKPREMQVRRYVPADYAGVQQNLQQNQLYDPSWDTPENLERMVSRDPESILVAVKKWEVIGNLFLLAPGWQAMIFRFAVRSEYQGNGIGSALLEAAEGILRKRGVTEVALFADAQDNQLHEYYQARGFRFDGEGRYRAMYKPL